MYLLKNNKFHFLLMRIITFCVAVVLFLPLLMFSGCFGPPKVYEDGYFLYCIIKFEGNEKSREQFGYHDGEKVVAIVGLTELGQEQEVIEFPRIITKNKKEYRVACLGWSWSAGFSTEDVFYYESPNLKKVWVPESIYYIAQGAFSRFHHLEMFFNGKNLPQAGFSDCLPSKPNIYVCAEDTDKSFKVSYWHEVFEANIAFMNNYSEEINGGYYRIDHMDIDELIPIPPEPKREEYSFTGWYVDPECTSAWKFDISPFGTGKNIAERLYLYAGWES